MNSKIRKIKKTRFSSFIAFLILAVALPLFLAMSLETASAVEFGTLIGRVTKFGEPINGACIEVSGEHYNAWPYTDSDGEYVIELQPGNRTLTARTKYQGVLIGTQNVTIMAGQTVVANFPPELPPVGAVESGLDEQGKLIFDGSKSSDPDGIIVSWEWILDNEDPYGSHFTLIGQTVETSNIDIGCYQVTLIVTDNDGLTGTDIIRVCIPSGYDNECQANLSTCSINLDTCQDEIDEINNTIADLQTQNANLSNSLTSANSIIENLKEENINLSSKLATANDNIQSQQEEINRLNTTIVDIQSDLEEVKPGLMQIENLLVTPVGQRESDTSYTGQLGDLLNTIIKMLLSNPGENISSNTPHGNKKGSK